MESITYTQALNILRSNKWIGNETFLESVDSLWDIFYDEFFSHGKLCFSYKQVFVGSFKFKQTGFIFKNIDPNDELYIAYLAILEEIRESKQQQADTKRAKILAEINTVYYNK